MVERGGAKGREAEGLRKFLVRGNVGGDRRLVCAGIEFIATTGSRRSYPAIWLMTMKVHFENDA